MEIYKVESEKTGERLFIGVWEEAKVCWENQLKLLRTSVHPNLALQKHFKKFGEDDLVMSVIRKEPESNVQKYLSKYLLEKQPVKAEVKAESKSESKLEKEEVVPKKGKLKK